MGINTVEAIQVGDTTQRIRVRGADTSTRPQGPGLPMINEVTGSSPWAGLLLRLSLGRGNPGVTADQVARRALSRPSNIRSIPNSWSWS
jgi:hypothetical protein